MELLQMKTNPIIIMSLLAIACACGPKEDVVEPEKVNISLSMSGLVDISERPFNGRLLNSDDPAYLLINAERNGTTFASGIFGPTVADVNLELLGDGSYEIFVRGIKKGTGFGLEVESGFYDPYGRQPIENSFSYNSPEEYQMYYSYSNVYDDIDSTSSTTSYLPELDTYYSNVSFEGADYSDGDTLNIDLDRRVFGVEAVTRNISTGKVTIYIYYSGLSETNNPAKITIDHPTDSVYQIRSLGHTQSTNGVYATRIYYDNGSGDELVFAEDLTYNLLKTKRFEINGGNFTTSGLNLSIVFSDQELTYGETIIVD